MINVQSYVKEKNISTGITQFILDHPDKYPLLGDSPDIIDIVKFIKQNAKEIMTAKEYDSFRKAITSLYSQKTSNLKNDNLYKLCFALNLSSDSEAQGFFTNYIHRNELSARALEEFILISILKLQGSYSDFTEIKEYFNEKILCQSVSPKVIEDGMTSIVYYHAIDAAINSKAELIQYLKRPENISFFTRTRNTQYLALFNDIELETIYQSNGDSTVRLITNYGSSDKETIYDYYLSLFGIQTSYSDDLLSESEITKLSEIYDGIFMSYENFCDLVQRKRPIDISAGTFLLSLLKNLESDDKSVDLDFYVDFRNPTEFQDVVNDILFYFGFPSLNPECSSFDSLILDVYSEVLSEKQYSSNAHFQEIYITKLRDYFRQIAHIQ